MDRKTDKYPHETGRVKAKKIEWDECHKSLVVHWFIERRCRFCKLQVASSKLNLEVELFKFATVWTAWWMDWWLSWVSVTACRVSHLRFEWKIGRDLRRSLSLSLFSPFSLRLCASSYFGTCIKEKLREGETHTHIQTHKQREGTRDKLSTEASVDAEEREREREWEGEKFSSTLPSMSE